MDKDADKSKPENKQMAPKDDDDEYIYSCTNSVVSGTECTGLIPTPPETDSEADSYSDLYTIPKPPVNNSKKNKTKD
jgi:phosphoserine aminotransferase